jgi:protein CpxP
MGQFMVDQMKFDSVQEAAYWKLRDTLVKEQKPVWDSIRIAKKRFFDLLNQPNPGDSLLQVRNNEVLVLQQKLDVITFRHFQQVRSLCRPDQFQKFDTVIKEIVNRMTFARRPNSKTDSADRK